MREFVTAARGEHPGLAVPDDAFVEHVKRHAGGDDVGTLRPGDLLLAFACAEGERGAIATFMSRYAEDAKRAVGKVRVGTADVDDLLQELLRRMFVKPDAKILEYSGRGDLRAWVRIVATRFALDLARVKKNNAERPTDDETFARREAASDGPETAFLRRHYRAEVAQAIEDAAKSLDPEDRNALREHYARGLNIDQIAAAHGIHRATAARRVQRAREALISAVKKLLDQRHGLAGRDLASVMALVRSQLHVTMERVLA